MNRERNQQAETDYARIESAIIFIRANFKDQPSLETIAAHVHLSPFHFQKMFTEWAGVSPKKFLQFISIEYAKSLLKEKQVTLFEAAAETGLSGTGRLHDLFITIEAMTPGEFKNGAESLTIKYAFEETPFGRVIIAATSKGICYLMFVADEDSAILGLRAHFPKAVLRSQPDRLHSNALKIFRHELKANDQVKLHLRGSDFQLKVWQALLQVPCGALTSYGNLANQILKPGASRAVGTAIGTNPVAYLIPCHRVIQASGDFGGYMWGPARKAAMVGWEAALPHKELISAS